MNLFRAINSIDTNCLNVQGRVSRALRVQGWPMQTRYVTVYFSNVIAHRVIQQQYTSALAGIFATYIFCQFILARPYYYYCCMTTNFYVNAIKIATVHDNKCSQIKIVHSFILFILHNSRPTWIRKPSWNLICHMVHVTWMILYFRDFHKEISTCKTVCW